MLLEATFGYKSVWRVLGIMAETPNRAYTRPELRKYTKLGNDPLTRALKILTIAGILLKSTNGKRSKYTLNQAHELTSLLIALEKTEIANLGHMDYFTKIAINEFMRKTIDRSKNIRRALLFGSVARGTATKHSDIDIAIITAKHDHKEEQAIDWIAVKIERKHARSIQTHYFTEREYQDRKDQLAAQIRKEGKDILGLPELFSAQPGTS